jgi:Transglutaminase-like superfamily
MSWSSSRIFGASGCSSTAVRDRAYALTLLRGPRDWVELLQVCLFATTVPIVLRLPLPRLAALVTRPPGVGPPRPAEIERLERVTTLAPRIARPLVRSGCLTRGLTLFWFLRRAGLDVELRFGLDPGEGRPTDGHCWLTLDGEPYLERRDPRHRFTELYRLPLAGRG